MDTIERALKNSENAPPLKQHKSYQVTCSPRCLERTHFLTYRYTQYNKQAKFTNKKKIPMRGLTIALKFDFELIFIQIRNPLYLVSYLIFLPSPRRTCCQQIHSLEPKQGTTGTRVKHIYRPFLRTLELNACLSW